MENNQIQGKGFRAVYTANSECGAGVYPEEKFIEEGCAPSSSQWFASEEEARNSFEELLRGLNDFSVN